MTTLGGRIALILGGLITLTVVGLLSLCLTQVGQHWIASLETESLVRATLHSGQIRTRLGRAYVTADQVSIVLKRNGGRFDARAREFLAGAMLTNPQLRRVLVRCSDPNEAWTIETRGDDLVIKASSPPRQAEGPPAGWSGPHSEADTLISTFCRQEDGCLVVVDVSLDDLAGELTQIRQEGGRYGFLATQAGDTLAFLAPGETQRKSNHSFAPSLQRALTSGESGVMKVEDPFFGLHSWISYAPIGETGLTLGVVYSLDRELADLRLLQRKLVGIGAGGLITVLLVLIWASRKIAHPLSLLSQSARKLADGELSEGMQPPDRTREVVELASSFQLLAQKLDSSRCELEGAVARQTNVAGELEVAAELQRSLLPRSLPACREVNVQAGTTPARVVGGDLYDAFWIDADHLGIVLGDVSGKGISAAIYMTLSRTRIRAAAMAGRQAGPCLQEANRDLCEDSRDSGMFVTVFYGVLNVRTGQLSYARAGQLPPLWIRPDGVVSLESAGDGPPLGILDDSHYPTHVVRLSPGDSLFLYTDGVTEAANAQRDFFGGERLLEVVGAWCGRPCERLHEEVLARVTEFRGQAQQSDDLTVMTLCFLSQRRRTDRALEEDSSEVRPGPLAEEQLAETVWHLGRNLEHRFRERGLMTQLTEKINAGLLLDGVLEHVFDSFRPIIPYDRIGLSLLEPHRWGTLVRTRWTRSDFDPVRLQNGYTARLEATSLQEVIRSRQPRVLNDLVDYLREHPGSTSTRLLVEEGVRSSLACPLVSAGRPVGFVFFSSRNERAYDEGHVESLKQVAGQLALLVEQSRLYEQLEILLQR